MCRITSKGAPNHSEITSKKLDGARFLSSRFMYEKYDTAVYVCTNSVIVAKALHSQIESCRQHYSNNPI